MQSLESGAHRAVTGKITTHKLHFFLQVAEVQETVHNAHSCTTYIYYIHKIFRNLDFVVKKSFHDTYQLYVLYMYMVQMFGDQSYCTKSGMIS